MARATGSAFALARELTPNDHLRHTTKDAQARAEQRCRRLSRWYVDVPLLSEALLLKLWDE